MAAPPYDVIDAAQRAELLGRSPYNVVEVDLPQNGADPYGHAAERPRALERRGDRRARRGARAVGARAGLHGPRRAAAHAPRRLRAREASTTTAPAASARTSARTPARRRTGCASRARRARTSRRSSASTTTRPTPPGTPSSRSRTTTPWGEVTDDEGTVHKLWRVDDPAAIDAFKAALKDTELLIADGHHRYETARVYQQEVAERRPRADVPGRAAGLRADGLPHAPPRDRLDADQNASSRRTLERDWTTEPRGHAQHRLLRRRRASRRCTSRTGRSPTPRWRASPSPTAGSTPRCSRR